MERFIPNPKLKFMEQCREVMRFRRLALRSEEAYLDWIKRFMVFHRGKATPHPVPLPDRGGEGMRVKGAVLTVDTSFPVAW